MKLCVNASLAFTKLEKRRTKTRKRGENDENGKKDGENGRWKSVVVLNTVKRDQEVEGLSQSNESERVRAYTVTLKQISKAFFQHCFE